LSNLGFLALDIGLGIIPFVPAVSGIAHNAASLAARAAKSVDTVYFTSKMRPALRIQLGALAKVYRYTGKHFQDIVVGIDGTKLGKYFQLGPTSERIRVLTQDIHMGDMGHIIVGSEGKNHNWNLLVKEPWKHHDAVETICRDVVADYAVYGRNLEGMAGYTLEVADNVTTITKQYGDCIVTVKYNEGSKVVSDAYVNAAQ